MKTVSTITLSLLAELILKDNADAPCRKVSALCCTVFMTDQYIAAVEVSAAAWQTKVRDASV